MRALSSRAAELETLARRLQADLEAAQEQLAEFVDAEERANSERTQQRARPEHRGRDDPRRRRVVEHARTRGDPSTASGRIVPLRPRNAMTAQAAARRDDALAHRTALAAEMRAMLTTLLRDALGPTRSRAAAAPSPPRPQTMLRAPVAGRKTRRPQVPPTTASTTAPVPVPPAIEDRRSRDLSPRPAELQATDAIVEATPQTLELIPSAVEPPAELGTAAVESQPAEQPAGAVEQAPLEDLPAPVDAAPVAQESTANDLALADRAETSTIGDAADMSAAAADSPEAEDVLLAASDADGDEGRAPADLDPRLIALAEATEAAIELPVERVVDEPANPIAAADVAVPEPFVAASADLQEASEPPDSATLESFYVAADAAPIAPSVDQSTASVDEISDPWTMDIPTEPVSSTVAESAPATYIDTPSVMDADAASHESQDHVIDVSSIDAPAQVDPSPTMPIAPPVVEPPRTVRELQVVLSTIGTFPELLRLQARIGSLSSVDTVRLRDFRNGIATFSVGVTETLTGREFGAVLQMFTELRLRLEGAGENTVELRVDPEAAR